MPYTLFPRSRPSQFGPTILRTIFIALATCVGATMAQRSASGADADSSSDKARIIVTTDLGADPDDEQSLVWLLVSANEFDIEGLIVSTGCWKKNQSNTAMLDKIVDAYGKALPSLQVHAKGYPSHAYLKSISVLGQTGYGMADVGEGSVGRAKDKARIEQLLQQADLDKSYSADVLQRHRLKLPTP